MPLVNFDLFSALMASSISGLLGVLVYLHNRRSATNIIFLILSLIGAIWAMVNYISLIAPPEIILFWIRLVLLFASAYVFLFFIFTINFPKSKLKINRQFLGAVLLTMFLLMGLAVSPFVFEAVKYLPEQQLPNPVPGPLMPLFALMLISVFLVTAILVIKKYLSSKGIVRRQWSALGLGLLVSYSLLIFLVFVQTALFQNTTFVPYSPLFILPTFIGSTYAIVRHYLFNVKLIATEIFVFLIILTSLFQVLVAKTTLTLAISMGTLLLLSIFSILLIRSVINEVKAREEIQRLVGQLEAANRKLREVDRIKSEFISIASHQLRTPLSIIKGYASMALEGDFGGWQSKEQKEVFRKILLSSERLINLVEDLLNISRLEQGKVGYDFKPTDIVKLVRGVVEELRPKAKEKGLKLTFYRSKKALPQLTIDPDKLRQVFVNLIDNSIKYTQEGEIKIRLQKGDSKVRISVSDTGAGLTQDELSVLFQRFMRGKRVTQLYTEGVGLGLYFAKNIISAHNGRIWATSPGKGKGSTFYVELPI